MSYCEAPECPRITERDEKLCGGHQGKLQHHLAVLPDLLDHLRENRMPGASHGEPITGTREPRLPFNVTAVDDADALFNLVADVSSALADIIGVERDALPGWRTDPNATVAGFRSGDTVEAAIGCCRFIYRHFDQLVLSDYAGVAACDFQDIVRPIVARWPMQDRRWALSNTVGLRCPKCSCLSLYRYPPTWQGGPVTTKCEMPECSIYLTEQDYEFLVNVEVELVKRQKKALA